jgi:phytoene desaturase
MQKLMEYTLVFLGSSPYTTPALYSIMSHVDFNLGVFYPEGGIESITKALFTIGSKYGAKFYVNAPVSKFLTNYDQVKGIEITGKPKKLEQFGDTSATFSDVLDRKSGADQDKITVSADVVISNAPYESTEKLLPANLRGYTQRYWNTRKLAPGAVLNYIGVKGELPQLRHHTLTFSEDWQSNFSDIFDRGAKPSDPSIYLSNTSKTDRTVAPEGYENLVLLVPISASADDSEVEIEQYNNSVYRKLKDVTGVDIPSNSVFTRTFTNRNFGERYNSLGGSALGISHDLLQTAVFRPKNRSKKVKNLYFAGADTQPGIGVPIVLISAQLVRDRVVRDVG